MEVILCILKQEKIMQGKFFAHVFTIHLFSHQTYL